MIPDQYKTGKKGALGNQSPFTRIVFNW